MPVFLGDVTMTVALLAPVPRVHLESALMEQRDLVAFGTNAFELFGKLRTSGALPVEVYIVATNNDGRGYDQSPSFKATCLRYVESSEVSRAELISMRPISTESDSAWGGYWVVSGLKKIPEKERRRLVDFIPAVKGEKFSPDYRARGPIRVHPPS